MFLFSLLLNGHLSQLVLFLTAYVVQIHIEGLCHGNLLEKEVLDISNIFKSNFSVQPMPVTMRHREQVICFPSGANFVRDVSVKNKSETNSVLEVTDDGPILYEISAKYSLFLLMFLCYY